MQSRRAVLFGALVLDGEVFGQLFEQLGGGQTVQVLHHAVVVDDAELARGEGHGKEVAVLLTPRMVGIPALALLSHTRRGGRAVMAVGDVQRRNILENLRNAVVGLPVTDNPQFVSEAVGGRKIVLRSVVFHHAGHDGVDLGVVGVGEEHRFDIGFLVADVDHAVLLLVGTRQFVLLDRARKVILEIAAHRQAVLRAAVHRLRIDIIVLFGILLKPALFAPCAEILDGLVVNLLRMFVRNGVEVDFGLDDMQQRTLGGFGLRLGGVQHVVGTRRHLGSVLFRGAYSPERFDSYHML